MGELQDEPPPPTSTSPPPATATSPPPASVEPPPPPPPPRFDPSRMIGIIRRKALIKDLAAAYHAECLTYCQELLELQRKCEESFIDTSIHSTRLPVYGGDAALKMSNRSSNMFFFMAIHTALSISLPHVHSIIAKVVELVC
ncbi:DNA ligase [Heracleum sosnowskyi]|uniref:DNA ligase n=1 Tax=Heracleum sosnowskyi TaxID=360622 RepID=A0AAD8I468_9APIA|nr:DNA ligase [Heracleum sosnowskyi]